MKHEFVKSQFKGARFDEHTLPLDVASDLVAYERLLTELAKRIYLKEHPERQRVPKNFGKDFQLHLERIEEGSTKLVLSVMTVGALALGGNTGDYFDRARDVISNCIAAPKDRLPEDFPKELLPHFNRLGRSLHADEELELLGENGTTATLTPERRKELVLAADKVYEKEIELAGTIEEADWKKSSIRLCLSDASKVNIPIPDSFHDQVRTYGGKDRHQVIISCIAAFDSYDKLARVVEVDPDIDIQEDYQLAARIEELKTLEDGWYDGQGSVLDKDKLDLIATQLIGKYPEVAPLPSIVPTPEGDLLFEWEAQGTPSLDIGMTDLRGYYHAFGDNRDIEERFDLSHDDEWNRLFEVLERLSVGAEV